MTHRSSASMLLLHRQCFGAIVTLRNEPVVSVHIQSEPKSLNLTLSLHTIRSAV